MSETAQRDQESRLKCKCICIQHIESRADSTDGESNEIKQEREVSGSKSGGPQNQAFESIGEGAEDQDLLGSLQGITVEQ